MANVNSINAVYKYVLDNHDKLFFSEILSRLDISVNLLNKIYAALELERLTIKNVEILKSTEPEKPIEKELEISDIKEAKSKSKTQRLSNKIVFVGRNYLPDEKKKFERPPAVYTNKRYLYSEIEQTY